MIRSIAIGLLVCMGLIANQLPLLWLSYKTVNQRYATFHCVNPKSDCNGSCHVKRTFVETKQVDEGRAGQLPSSLLQDITELGPFLPLLVHHTTHRDFTLDAVVVTEPTHIGLSHPPPTPPPEA